jgi:DNA-binding MarR family transcriptional regulator
VPTGGVQVEPRLASYTGYLAHLASLRAEQYTRAALPSGRDTRDLAVLSILAEAALSQAETGILLDVNRTVMISVIDRLEAAGLAYRERDPADRRRYALRITPDGKTALAGMQEAASRANRSLTAPLGGAGHRRLNEFLRLIAPQEPGALPESLTSQTGFLLDQGTPGRRPRQDRLASLLGTAETTELNNLLTRIATTAHQR